MPNKNEKATKAAPAGGHGPAVTRPIEKAKDFGGTMRKLIATLKEFYLQIIAIVVFVIASVVLSIISPKLLGNITNQITDDYMAMKVWDGIHEQLPDGVSLPDGTTVSDLVEMATKSGQVSQFTEANQQLDSLTDSQRDKLMNLDLAKRPSINFDVIAKIALWLIAIYVMSALFNYIES